MQSDFLPDHPSLVRQVLWQRGWRDSVEAEKFLNPSIQDIPLPFGKLRDVEEAVKILLLARDQKERVVIYGDYDVDGSTSTALLVRLLEDWGFDVRFFIPHRIEDGYGLTVKGIEKMLSRIADVKVVVTVDNGISSFEGVDFLKQRGIRVIVTDHHEPSAQRVAADAVLNPRQKNCLYPDKNLAGVGVAFLLAIALRRALGIRDHSLQPSLDLVAVGTVCDLAQLTGVNRMIVKTALPRLLQSSFLGLRVLASRSPSGEALRPLRAKDLGFFVGPRLNAAGRVGEPDWGVQCLLAQDPVEAIRWADKLEIENQRRRDLQDSQVAQAERVASEFSAPDVYLVKSEDFHLGIVGLVASRLTEKYRKPSCVLTRLVDEHELAFHPESTQGLWKGSLRAPQGYHLAAALDWMKLQDPSLLKSAGGHALAAGVAVEEGRVSDFEDLLPEAIRVTRQGPIVNDAAEFELESMEHILEGIDILEPFGQGFASPRVSLKGFVLEQAQVMKEVHLKLWGVFKGQRIGVLQFRSPWAKLADKALKKSAEIDLIAEVGENWWNGRRTAEFHLKEITALKSQGSWLDVSATIAENSDAQRAS
jgi:single-stranded-DNA-specific exonuclease